MRESSNRPHRRSRLDGEEPMPSSTRPPRSSSETIRRGRFSRSWPRATDEIARKVAADYGARRWTSNWREAVADPNVDVVDIVTPNSMHREMGPRRGRRPGKHVYCEKPLGLNADETREMVRAVSDAGVLSLVGHNFPHNPIHAVARDMIRAGELGDIVHARVSFNSDFLADEAAPFIWRCDRAAAGERHPRRHQRAPLQPHRVPGGADRGGLREDADRGQGARRGGGRVVRGAAAAP